MSDFLDCVIRCAQNGYEKDVQHMSFLNREMWVEQQFWAAIKDIKHGPEEKTRLMFHCYNGNLQRIQWLLKLGAKTDIVDFEGKNCLTWACIGGELDTVKYLIENEKMDPNVKCCKQKTCFHYACESGHLNIVEYLYDKCDPNECAMKSSYPIHFAVHYLSIIQFLFEKMDVLNKISEDGTVLHKAVSYELEHVVDYLLENDIDLNALNWCNETALFIATSLNNIRLMEKLLDHGARTDLLDLNGINVLLTACSMDNQEAVELLVSKNVENIPDTFGASALHYVAANNNLALLTFLIETCHFPFEITDIQQQTPLFYAIRNPQCFEYLLSKCANPNATVSGESLLMHAIKSRCFECTKLLLLRADCDVNVQCHRSGLTALHICAQRGEIEMTRQILRRKDLDIHIKSYGNMLTPLHFAAKMGFCEIIQDLLRHGVNIDDTTSNSQTALMIAAAQRNNQQAVQKLLAYGANENMKNQTLGFTALMVACHSGHFENVKLLWPKGTRNYSRSNTGHTPLFICSWRKFGKIAEYLLQNGADPNECDNDGNTCLITACDDGCLEMVVILLTYGANPNLANGALSPLIAAGNDKEIRSQLKQWGAYE